MVLQNSVRHSLSLSRNFRRIGVKVGEVKMKKGLEWEVIPERREAVDREMELYHENMKSSDGGGSNSSTVTSGEKGTLTEHGEETDQ